MTSRKPIDDAAQQPTAVSSPAPGTWFGRRPWLPALALVIVTFVAYIPAMRGGFAWDDDILITDNRMVHARDGLYRLWFTTEAANYYPLTWSLCWLEWRSWGDHATGYHVVNVLLHAINAILVWTVLRRLKVPGAWLAGLVFAIHPVNVATVAWISEQKNTLSMLFYLVAILLYLRFDEKGRWRWSGLSLGAFLLALFSKTAVVMLPVVLLGCVWWLRGPLRRQDLLRSVPFFVLSLVMGLVTVWFENNRDLGGQSTRTDGFLSHLAIAGRAPWFYLYKAFLPFNLSVIYPKWDINPSLWISYLPGMALVGCLTLFWWKRQAWGRPLLFSLGYFVVMFFPVLGFFDQAFYLQSLVADHWQYYSIVGPIALAIGAGAAVCSRMSSRRRAWATAATAAVLTVLGAATWQRGRIYATEETLWRDTVAKNPNNSLAHSNLGSALAKTGKIEEAIAHYEQALRINPDLALAHYNLGIILAKTGKIEDAITQYEQAVHLKPGFAEPHYNLGAALAKRGKIEEAIAHYEQAVRLKPDFAEAQNNLGSALQQLGRLEEAKEHYEQAVRLAPDDAHARNNLGVVLFLLHNVPEAKAQYEEALRLEPDYAKAHLNLGLALAQLGRVPEAMEHWEQALRINPDYAEPHYYLGMALEQAGRTDEAIAHYEQAVRLKPDFAEARTALARLQARQ
jgi:tetratricopeptide (TPR) repeat protein